MAEMWTRVTWLGLESWFWWLQNRLDKITHDSRLDLDLTAIDLRLDSDFAPLTCNDSIRQKHLFFYITNIFPASRARYQRRIHFREKKTAREDKSTLVSSIISKRNFDIIYILFRITVLVSYRLRLRWRWSVSSFSSVARFGGFPRPIGLHFEDV